MKKLIGQENQSSFNGFSMGRLHLERQRAGRQEELAHRSWEMKWRPALGVRRLGFYFLVPGVTLGKSCSLQPAPSFPYANW